MNKSFLEEKISIQEALINFLDNTDNTDEIFQDFVFILKKYKFLDDSNKTKIFLQLLRDISDNHHRNSSFITKISRILILFKDEIKRIFTNSEICDFYVDNKRILLILIENKIITIDEYFVSKIFLDKYVKMHYPLYFYPEIRTYIDQCYLNAKLYESYSYNLPLPEGEPEKFYEKRNNGENDNFLCELIRQDKLDDFIIYSHETNLNFEKLIDQSIFETNSYLIGKELTMIEYAAFFGSIRIFQYLRNNKVELTKSLWDFAIHSNNSELIYFLENCKKEIFIEDFQSPFNESIKCHHNDIARYIQSNNDGILGYTYLIQYHNYQLIDEILYDIDNINIKEDFQDEVFNEEKKEFHKITTERTLLDLAIEIEDIDIVNCILSNENLDINNPSKLISHFSYTLDYEEEEDGPEEINEEEKRTPLILAIQKENIEIVNLLLKNDKIDVNISTDTLKSSRSVTFYPSCGGISSDLEQSVEKEELTPLYLAVLKKNNEIIKLLLANDKLNINAISKIDKKQQINSNGFGDGGTWECTALHLAVYNGPEIVSLLLNYKGIDVSIQDSRGNDPIYYAKSVSPEILDLLTKKKNETSI